MTSSFPFPRRPVPRWAWPLVLCGWLTLPPAAIATLTLSDIYGVGVLAGLACVVVGSFFLSGRKWATIPVTVIGGVFLFTGVIMSTDALAKNLWGETATCRVADVEKGTYTTTHRSESNGRTETETTTRTHYGHTLQCPDREYLLYASHPFAVGEDAEVLFDPRSQRPEFTFGERHKDLTAGVVLLSAGGLVILLSPPVAWRIGRRVNPAPRRRTPSRWSWPLVAAGWLSILAAVGATLLLSQLYVFALVPAVACAAIGSYYLSGRRWPLIAPVVMIGGFCTFLGVVIGTDALANNLWGTTGTCQVTRVEPEVRIETTRDAQGRERTRDRSYYAHQTACSDGTYWIDASRRHAVGAQVEVRYDPRSQQPHFNTGDRSEELGFGAIMLAIGAPILLLLPVVAWRVGRRRPSNPPLTGQGPAAVDPAPRPWPADRSVAVPIESPEYESTLRNAAGVRPMSPTALLLSIMVRVTRRRRGVQTPPPPNPLAGKYPPPPQPPPYRQWPSDQ